MDTKQLVDKFINGEITEEQFDAEKAKLSTEEQESLKKEADARTGDAIEKLKGIRRGIDKVGEKQQKKIEEQDIALVSQMKTENLDKAYNDFFTEVGFDKEEDIKSFKASFTGDSTKSINVENIVKDMKAFYASTKSDEFFDLKKKQRDAEIAAEEYNAQNAGANGSGSGDDSSKKVSKEVKEFMEASRKAGRPLTPEQAEKRLALAKNGGHLN